VLNLPEIMEVLGPRPYPMKESVAEYLQEIKTRAEMDEKLVEDEFNRWLDAIRKDSPD
jgi:hypothetical protein